MKVSITGGNGYIGKALQKVGGTVLVCDVTDRDQTEAIICKASPDIVIHLAGESSPDKCQLDPKTTGHINFWGSNVVAEICISKKIPVVLLSSAQIWKGTWWESIWNKHRETSRFTPPVNSYGMQKVAAEFCFQTANEIGVRTNGGESYAKIVRTSLVFNKERFKKNLDDLSCGVPIDAPRFLHRSFIHLDDFVYLLSDYCKRFHAMPPVLHLAGSRTVSYYEFWLEVCRQFKYDPKLVKGRRREKDSVFIAKRPHYAGLDISLSQEKYFKTFDYVGGIKRMKEES